MKRNICKCFCKKSLCKKHIQNEKNSECFNSCYLFHTRRNTSVIYHTSLFPLPKNFEAKLLFTGDDWVRIGITFNKDIIHDQNDKNCHKYDIYCILEDLIQFYKKSLGWKNCFSNGGRPIKADDYMTLILKNGELRFMVNDIDLGYCYKNRYN